MVPNDKESDCKILHNPIIDFVYVTESKMRREWKEGADAHITRIGIGIPTTTEGTQLTNPDSLPILNILLPSFLQMMDNTVSPSREFI